MNCPQCHDRLQQRLDGVPPGDDHDGHLAACPECRDWHAAAGRLEEGLRLITPPAPPSGLTNRVVASVLADHRRRRSAWRRAARTAVALAAGLLVVVLVGDHLGRVHSPAPLPPVPPGPAPSRSEQAASGSLRDSVAEASDAVVSLGKRTADEAVGHGKLLLGAVAVPPPPEVTMPPSPIEPPARSLATATQAIGVGLEPVTDSARRAFGLLLRDMAPMDQPEDKPGL